MRQNLMVCLLAVCATLLGVNLVVSLRSPLPPVLGQAAGTGQGEFVLATGMNQSGNQAVLYVFNVTSKKLACYTTRTQGIEFQGVREVTYDLMPQELNPRGRKLTVEQVKEAVKKGGKGK